MRAARLALCSAALLEAVLFGQDSPHTTVLEGIYTAAQAMRGEAQYQMHCSRCHGEDLSGRAMGPLKGDKFLDRWREDSLGLLYDYIRTQMPASEPGTLTATAYIDILAFLLQQNSIPPGSKDLAADVLTTIILVGKAGPKPLSTNALIRVSGCAIQEGQDWLVINATDPVRTRSPEQTTPEEMKQAASQPLGSERFRLQNAEDLSGFLPEKMRNERVQVKGVLIRQTNRDRINVLRIDIVGASCP